MRPIVRLTAIITVEIAAVILLTRAAASTGQVPVEGFSAWVRSAPPEDALVALARLAGLLLGWWCLATTVLYVAARILRRETLAIVTGRICLPLVRRTVDSAFAAGIVLAAVAGPVASGAGAAPTPHAVVASAAALAAAPVPAPAPTAEHLQERPSVVVKKGDSLWRLAERNLGDGRRYPVLWEANRGRTMTDGRQFTNPNLIRPGWHLDLAEPAAALPTEPAPSPLPGPDPPPPLPTTPPSVPPTTAAPDAPDTDEPASPAPPATTAPAPPPASATAGSSPPPPDAADHLTPPATGPADNPPPSTIGAAASPITPTTGTAAPATAPPRRHSTSRPGIALIGLSGLGAAVLLGSLHRARRLALRRQGPVDGSLSQQGDQRSEARVRAVADDEALRWADAVNRLLAANADDDESPLPSVQTMRVGALGVELLLTRPGPRPPNGFVTADGDWVWRVDSELTLDEIEQAVAGAIPAMPALVELGRDADGTILVDLEHIERLALRGPAPASQRVAAHLASQLVGAPWSRGVEVRLVGASPTTTAPPLEKMEAARALLAAVTGPASRVIWAGAPSTLAARRQLATRDLYPPVVLIADHELSDEEASSLAELVPVSSPGVAVVHPDPAAAAGYILDIDDAGNGRLEPLGLQLITSGLAIEAGETQEAPGDCGGSGADEHPGQVDVLVLGPLDLAGTNQSPHGAPLEAQVLIRLAFEGRPYAGTSLREDMYPLGTTSEQTFATTLKRARRRFGEDSEGQPLIGPVTEGKIATAEAVTCDWRRFQALAARGDPDGLRAALHLVRGEPFTELPVGYEWVTPGLVHRIQARIADVAQALSATYLEAGSPVDARWAADQGLLAVPDSEPLRIARARAEAAAGDLAAVRRTIQEIHEVAADLDVPVLAETEAALMAINAEAREQSNEDRRTA